MTMVVKTSGISIVWKTDCTRLIDYLLVYKKREDADGVLSSN